MPITAQEVASANALSAMRENRELKERVTELENTVDDLMIQMSDLRSVIARLERGNRPKVVRPVRTPYGSWDWPEGDK